MAGHKSKLTVTVELSRAYRKYSGDPASPHFVPDSPLVDRQILPIDEEEELKRICTLVLANVQSADEDEDKSFAYLGNQIRKRDKSDKHSKDDSMNIQKAGDLGKPHISNRLNGAMDNIRVPDTTRNPSSAIATGYTILDQKSQPENTASTTITATISRESSNDVLVGLPVIKPQVAAPEAEETLDADGAERARAWMTNFLENQMWNVDEASSSTITSINQGHERSTKYVRTHRKTNSNKRSLSYIDAAQIGLNKRLPAVPSQQPVRQRPHITRLMKSIRRKKPAASEGDREHQGNDASALSTNFAVTPSIKIFSPENQENQASDPACQSSPPCTNSSQDSDQIPRKKRPLTQRLGSKFDWRRPKMLVVPAV